VLRNIAAPELNSADAIGLCARGAEADVVLCDMCGTSRTRREAIRVIGNPTTSKHEVPLFVEQPGRLPLRQEIADRASRALGLGMRILSAPRIVGIRIDDPNGDLYLKDADAKALSVRLKRYEAIGTAIEARGVGFAQALRVAELLARRASVSENWYVSLGRASDRYAVNKIARAVAESADGDSIAAHYSYAVDPFCTEDRAKKAGASSIMHPLHRAWLSRNFGVKFVSIAELAAVVSVAGCC
jgi:hypothetical protein